MSETWQLPLPDEDPLQSAWPQVRAFVKIGCLVSRSAGKGRAALDVGLAALGEVWAEVERLRAIEQAASDFRSKVWAEVERLRAIEQAARDFRDKVFTPSALDAFDVLRTALGEE